MSDRDDHVISYGEAVRRHRLLEEQKRRDVSRDLKMSDAMSHLLEEEAAQEVEGATPAHLRQIVEREFGADGGRAGQAEDQHATGFTDAPASTRDRRPRDAEGRGETGEPPEEPRRR